MKQPAQPAKKNSSRTTLMRRFDSVITGLLLFVVMPTSVALVSGVRFEHWGITALTLAASTFRSLPIRDPVQISQMPEIWIDRGDLSLRRPQLSGMLGDRLPGFSDGAEQGVIVSAQRVILKKALIVVNVPRAARSSEPGYEAAALANALRPLQGFSFDKLVLKQATVVIARPTGGTQTLEQVDADVFATPSRGVTSARGSFVLRGEKVSFDATIGASDSKAETDAGASHALRVSITSRVNDGLFDGIVVTQPSPRLSGRLDFSSLNLRSFANWFGAELLDGRSFGAFKVKADATWRDGALALNDATLTLDGNVGTGALLIDTAKPTPFINSTLAFRTLDLAPYIEDAVSFHGQGAADHAAAAGPAGRRSDIFTALFSRLDADLRVSASKISGLGLESGKGAASISLRSGRVLADIVDFELQKGTASGHVSLETQAPQPAFAARGSLDGVELGPIFAAFGDIVHLPGQDGSARTVLDGRGTLTLDIKGRGETLEAAVKSIDGDAQVTLRDGGKTGINVNQLLREAQRRKVFRWTTEARGDMTFDELTADLAFRHGTLISQALRLRANGTAMVANGRTNLGSRQMEMRVKVESAPSGLFSSGPARGQGIVLMGSWAHPIIHWDDASSDQPAVKAFSIGGGDAAIAPTRLTPGP